MDFTLGAYALSQRIDWPHTRDEWRVMVGAGQMLTVHDGFRFYGTTLLSRYSDLASIGMVLVDPEYRRQGIATSLTRTAVKNALNSGINLISLMSSHQGESVYRKVGFEQIGSLVVMSRPAISSSPFVKPKNSVLQTTPRELAKKYYESCPKRENMLSAVFSGSNGTLYAETDNSGVRGFAGSFIRIRPNGDMSLAIGPFLADTSETAGRLIQKFVNDYSIKMTCFVLKDFKSESADCSLIREEVQNLLMKQQFKVDDVLPVMTYKGKTAPHYQKPEIVSPISLAFG